MEIKMMKPHSKRETLEVQFVSEYAGECRLVWGVDGWNALPENTWPSGSSRTVRGGVSTPMRRTGNTHTAYVEIPGDCDFNYGILVTMDRKGRSVYSWVDPKACHSVVLRHHKHRSMKALLKLLLFRFIVIFRKHEDSGFMDKLPLNFVVPDRPYTRFIILSQGRTGSSYLRSLLSSHPQIRSYSELFHNDESERQRQSKPLGTYLEINDDPIWFLNHHVYKLLPDSVKAVGFKMLYGHAPHPNWWAAWNYLQHAGVYVIHLKRRNLVDRYLSSRLASRTGQWMARDPMATEPYNKPIQINPEACLEDMFNTLQNQVKYDHIFQDNPTLEVYYEDLLNSLDSEMTRIHNFLHVGPIPPRPARSIRQRVKPKSEVIANYGDLRKTFELWIKENRIPEAWLNYLDS